MTVLSMDWQNDRAIGLSHEVVPGASQDRYLDIQRGLLAHHAFMHQIRTHTHVPRTGYTRESHAEMAPPYNARRVDSSWARAIAIQEMTVSEPMTL